ncbi:MAG: hypothetical protein AB7G37_06275 [Solirubrobacteraceae bacterium]
MAQRRRIEAVVEADGVFIDVPESAGVGDFERPFEVRVAGVPMFAVSPTGPLFPDGEGGLTAAPSGGGSDGASAYELAVAEGFEGNQVEWLASLEGTDGSSAYQLALVEGFEGSQAEWIASLAGAPGEPGAAATGRGSGLFEVVTADVDAVGVAGNSPGVDLATVTVPAGDLEGHVLRLTAHCTLLNNSGEGVNFQAKIRAGSDEATSGNASVVTGANRRSWIFQAVFVAQGDSAVSTAVYAMASTATANDIQGSAGGAHPWLIGVFDQAVDLTVEQTFTLRVQHQGADATVDVTCESSFWELLIPYDEVVMTGSDTGDLEARVEVLENQGPYDGTSLDRYLAPSVTWTSLGTVATEAGSAANEYRSYVDLTDYSSFRVQGAVIAGHADARWAVAYSDDAGESWNYLTDSTELAGGTAPAGNAVVGATGANPRVTGTGMSTIHADAKKLVLLGIFGWMLSGSADVELANVSIQFER